MDTLADYEAWKTKQRKSRIGAATVVLGAADAQPDQLAGDLNLASEFGKLTGKPVPSTPMVTEYRSVFQQAVEKTRAETILSSSPRLTEWLRNPENATLAKDDLDGLSWWETALGASWNSVRRAGSSVPQVYNQALALEYSQDAADLKRGFGEILYDERTPVIDENGVELTRNWANPGDLLGAAWRYYDSRIAGGLAALGVTDDPAQVAAQYQMQAEELRRNIGAIPMSPGAQAVREKLGTINGGTWQEQLSQFGALIAEDPIGFTSFIGQVGLESAPSIAASVGVGVATRNPGAAAATMGALSGAREYGSSAGDVVADGGYDLTTPDGALAAISDRALMRKAQDTGQVRALVIGALDGLSGGVAGKVLAQNPVGNMLLQTMTQSLFGSGGEALAQTASGQDLKLADILIEGLAEAFTAPAEVAGMGLAKVREMQGKARDAEARVALFQELSGQSVNSKLRARMPDRFRQFVDQATAKGPVENVFVPAQDFVQYFQTSGVDPYALIDELDGVTRDDLDAALAGGGDLRIPTSTYAAKLAGSEHDAFLMENMRFDPLDMTAREAVEFNARVDDIMQDMWAEAEDIRQDADRWRAVEDQIHDQVVSQMRAAGLSTERAMAEVQPIVAFYRTRAARMGLTTEEYLANNPLPQIQGAIPQGVQFKNVDDLNRTLAEARNRRAPKADTRQSLLEFIADYGGVNDVGGEFKARDAEVIKRGRGKKTLRLTRDDFNAGQGSLLGPNVGGKRFGYDDVAHAAIESGFMADDPLVLEYKAALRDGTEAPDITLALFAAVDAELSGNKQASDQDADPVDESYLDEIEGYLNRLGLDLSNTDDEIRAAIDADQAAPDRMYGQDGGSRADGDGSRNYVIYDDSRVEVSSYEQNQSGPRGSMQFNMDGSSLIRLFETANLSTLQHETGHLFLTMLQRDAATGDAATVAEYEVIKSWWRENAKAVAADGNRAMPDAKLTPEDVQRAIDLGTTGDMMKDAAVDVGMQEQWARGYEAYEMEGKAPSVELRAVFAKFRSWMISVYKSMVGLNVKINDDIRGVFDRMLATDDEIAKAKASSGETGAVFATAEQMGLTADEFERFQKLRVQAEDESKARLQIEIMEPIRRETKKEYMAEKAKVTEATTANLRRAPVFRAIQEMRFGETFEGEETPIKLDRGIIEDQYGAGYIPFLPGATKNGNGHRNAVFAAEGLHPDVAAGMYGFATGRELLDAMSNAPEINAAINAEVEAEMYRRHGDPLKDGEIERRALEVLHNDKRGEWMAAELKAVAEVAGVDVALTMKDARTSARQALGLMRVKDATAAMRFLAAERKAGNQAARLGAMLARDGVWMQNARRRIATKSRAALRDNATVGAVAGQVEKANASIENYSDTVQRLVDAKRRQLMNHALFMEATKQRVAVEKITDRIAKLNRSDKRLAGSITVDHVKAARAIAAKFGLARADSAFDFNAWLEQLTFDDPIRAGALSEAVAAWGEIDKNYRDMAVNEFGALVDSIDNVLETGKRFSGIETAGKRVDREQAVAELTAVFDDRGYAENEAMSGAMKGLKKIMHDAKTLTSSSRAMLRVMETWARTMDNGEQGPFTNYLVRPVMDALGQYFENRKDKMDDLLAIVEGAKSKMNGNAIPAPELRGQGSQPYAFQNKAALLHAILHTGNESNKAKLLIGWGFSDGFVNQTQAVTAQGKVRAKKDGTPILTKGELDTTRWDAFLDRMIREGMITSEDIDLVNSIWGVFEETKRPAQSTHKKLKGFYFKEIENSPYQTAAGMLKGGYVPAMIDKEASLDAGRQGDMRALDQSSTSMFPSTGAGFTKSRVENYREPLELNLMLLPSHLDDVLRFTYLEPAIQQTASLVRGRDLRDTMQRADPNLVGDTIMPWLQRTASRSLDTGATTAGRRRWGRTFDRLRSRIGISIMFMNVVNIAQQITGPIVAASEVSPRRLGRALVRMVSGDAPAMRKAIEDASPYMKERLRLVANDSQIALRDLVQDKGVFTDVDRFTQKHGYLLQSAFQSVLDVPVWHGAYDQAISRGMDRDAAIFEADSAVRRFMPDSAPENVTAFAQGSVTWRMITMFTSFFISQANLLGGRMDVIRRTMGWNGAPQAFWAYLTVFALPAIVAQAISDAASGAGPEDEDEDGMINELLAWFGMTQLRYGAAMVPFAGQATLRTISAFNDNPVDDRLSVSPVVSSVETAVRAGASIYGAIADDKSARRATIDGLTVIALVTGIPTGQLGKLLGYGVGVSEGRYDPTGPVDVVQGVVSGRDGTER